MSIIVIEGSNGSGKTEVINRIINRYHMIGKKSIPDWYRDAILFARECPYDLQKEIYLYGHEANYLECDSEQDYIFDRYVYSTMIRINYSLGKSVEETVNEILCFPYQPDLVIVLRASIEEIKKRLDARQNFDFSEDFYHYENQIYDHLFNICDTIFIVDNNGDINDTIKSMLDLIRQKTSVRKKGKHERRI